jgi:hypothetical protein
MASTVKVHNVSLQASERDIKEFFCFSGDIIHVEMQGLVSHIPMIQLLSLDLLDDMCYVNLTMLYSADERSQFAYITFKSDQEAERAMLLTV